MLVKICATFFAAAGTLTMVGVLMVVPALEAANLKREAEAAAQGSNPGVVCAGPDGAVPVVGPYSQQEVQNAAEIVAVGKEMGLPERAWVIAVATAMQESTLRVLDHGDAAGPDSRGLFQQRDSWGPREVRMTARGSARLFYERLVNVPNWQNRPLTMVAQEVQKSGHPERYAKHEPLANRVVGAVQGISCVAAPPGPDGGTKGGQVVAAAMKQLGQPYAWGGGTATGPSKGISDNGGAADAHKDYLKVGFDCSGLTLYAYAQIGVTIPRNTQLIWNAYRNNAITDRSALIPGDLLLFGTNRSGSAVHHVGIYMGNGQMVHAPKSGEVVQVASNVLAAGSWYEREFVGAARPWAITRNDPRV